jgi:hypothetical protein
VVKGKDGDMEGVNGRTMWEGRVENGRGIMPNGRGKGEGNFVGGERENTVRGMMGGGEGVCGRIGGKGLEVRARMEEGLWRRLEGCGIAV